MDGVQKAAQAKAVVESLCGELGLQEACRQAVDSISALFRRQAAVVIDTLPGCQLLCPPQAIPLAVSC